jgi:hypothetical protein
MTRCTAIAAVFVAVVLCGCSGDGEDAGGQPSLQSAYESLLALIPDTAETRRGVTMTNYVRGRELIGVDLPSDPNNEAALDAYLAEFAKQSVGSKDVRPFGGQVFIGGYDQYGRLVIRPSSIGYGAAHVDGEAFAGAPPRAYQAVIGRFNPDASKSAIDSCDACPAPSVQQHQGTTFYAWGNDFEQNLRSRLTAPAFDFLGRGGRMVFSDGFVLRAEWTDGIKAMIDASRGEASLGKNSDYVAMARELDAMGAYTAHLSDQVQSRAIGLPPGIPSDSSTAAIRTLWNPPPGEVVLSRYRYLGIGSARDSRGSFVAIVLLHESEAAASRNAKLLPRRIEAASNFRGTRWSDIFTEVTAEADGVLLKARLYGPPSAADFLFLADPLLLSE